MKPEWKNLAPGLVRQRVIIEGTTEKIVGPEQIKDYLEKLAEVTKMEKLSGPYAYSAHDMGWGGWIHWKTSGAAFYSYPTTPLSLPLIAIPANPFLPKRLPNLPKNTSMQLSLSGRRFSLYFFEPDPHTSLQLVKAC